MAGTSEMQKIKIWFISMTPVQLNSEINTFKTFWLVYI